MFRITVTSFGFALDFHGEKYLLSAVPKYRCRILCTTWSRYEYQNCLETGALIREVLLGAVYLKTVKSIVSWKKYQRCSIKNACGGFGDIFPVDNMGNNGIIMELAVLTFLLPPRVSDVNCILSVHLRCEYCGTCNTMLPARFYQLEVKRLPLG